MSQYIKATIAEMKHVVWPKRKKVWSFTALVVIFSLVMAYYYGLLDWIFRQVLGFIV